MPLALVAVFVTTFGCSSSQRGSVEGENPSEPSTSALPPTTQQLPPQGAQGQAPPERYEGLKMGEPAKFKNGLIVTLEEASLMQVPVPLREKLGTDDRLVAVHFSVENANPEDQMSPRSFNITTALWQALDQNGSPLETLYPLETTLIAGELPNPSPDYPYLGWQGQLRPGQKRQGAVLFAIPPSTKKMRVRFTHPVMGPPPVGEWELGTVSELPQVP